MQPANQNAAMGGVMMSVPNQKGAMGGALMQPTNQGMRMTGAPANSTTTMMSIGPTGGVYMPMGCQGGVLPSQANQGVPMGGVMMQPANQNGGMGGVMMQPANQMFNMMYMPQQGGFYVASPQTRPSAQ